MEWWAYVLIVLALFTAALFANYVVKKINEVRMEERYNRIKNKGRADEPIQIRRRLPSKLLAMGKTPLEVVIEQSNPSTVKGDTIRGEKNTINAANLLDIRNFPKDIAHARLPEETSEEPKSCIVEDKPIFLGKIYNEINIGRSKSMSEADDNRKNSDDAGIRKQSKSIPSVRKLLDSQTDEEDDFKKWRVKSSNVQGSEEH